MAVGRPGRPGWVLAVAMALAGCGADGDGGSYSFCARLDAVDRGTAAAFDPLAVAATPEELAAAVDRARLALAEVATDDAQEALMGFAGATCVSA